MPRHPNDPILTPEILCLREAELQAMSPVEYRNLVVPLMNALSTTAFPPRGGPFGILGRWTKKYTRKRIYEVLVFLYNGRKRTDHLVPLVTEMLKEKYTESKPYEELDQSDESLYGAKQ
jgi:hypothetical protein